MPAINPYLLFNGNAEEAFNYYKSIFGGEFTGIMRYKDAPGEHKLSESENEMIMHVSLPLTGGTVLMGSDTPEERGKTIIGNNIQLSYNVKSESEADHIFKGLSENGKISMPMAKTFWGSYFGMLKDQFGINWMISYEYPKEA